MVGSQVRTVGMGEIVGLDYGAILAVFGLYDIEGPEGIDLFEKIVVLSDLFLKDAREKASEKEAREKQRREAEQIPEKGR